MRWNDLLTADRIVMLVDPGTIAGVLDAAARLLSEGSPATTQLIADALRQREQLGSTAIGHGVAVPHARIDGMTSVRGVFLRLETPVGFDAVDDRPVDLIFALFAPPTAGADHLRALAAVSRALRSPELREKLRQARNIDAVRALFVRDEAATAA